MRNNLFRDTALLVAAVLLTTAFWSCSKDEDPEPTPPIVSVTGVTLNKTGITLEVDGSETLTATVAPDNATNKKVTWKSDKPEIATVDASGKITGVKEGEATITLSSWTASRASFCTWKRSITFTAFGNASLHIRPIDPAMSRVTSMTC